LPASKHTRKANTPKRARQWRHVEESMAARGASRGAQIRAANAAVKRSYRKSRRSSGR